LSNIVIAVLFAGTLTGCVVGPDYKTPDLALPAHWGSKAGSKPSQAPQLSQWWKQLGDPTLDALIEEAIASNLDIATAKAKIREARATYREQKGALLPAASGTASGARTRTSAAEGGTTDASFSTLYEGGFDASWELDLFGGNKRAAEAAKYGVDAADEQLRDTMLTLIGDVASYYVQAREYQALRDLAKRTAASQRESAALTRQEYRAGSATGVDIAKADALANSTEADIPTYEISYSEAVHRLGVLLGKPPATLEDRLKASRPIPSPKMNVSIGIPADILVSRPDVRLAERQLAQYTAKIGQAEANRYPSLSLTGDISLSAASIGDLARKSSIGWTFGPTLTVPIFQGGQLKAAVDVAKAERDQYFIAYQSAVLSAMEDVENAVVALTQERQRYGKLVSSSSSYRRASNLSRTMNQAGVIGFLDVLDAERSLYSAEEDMIQSRASIATNYIALNKALGGGWNGQVDVAAPAMVDTNTGPHLANAK